MYFENSTTEKLIGRIVEILKRVNRNRKVSGASKFPISQIIAPLYWQLTTSRNQNPDINNFIDDLAMYPDFDVKLQNNYWVTPIGTPSFDMVIGVRRTQTFGDSYSSPEHPYNYHYIISFTKVLFNDEEFWECELRKVIDSAKGFWEPHNMIITSDENVISYYDFIEEFDDYCKQAKGKNNDKTRKSRRAKID